MAIFYTVPAWLGIILTAVVFVVLACAGHIAVRRTFGHEDLIPHNEVAGFIVAVVGVLYAVLLAFVTVIVWEHFASAEEWASQEVDAVTDLWRFSAFVDPPDERRLRIDINALVESVIVDEWPAMAHGESSRKTQAGVIRLLGDAMRLPVRNIREGNLQNRILDRMQTVADLRRRRINDNESGVPSVLWVALLAGAAAVIGFIYLFGVKNFRVQLLMTAATASVIGLSFGVIVALDYPFRGDVAVSPDRWIRLHALISAEPLP